MEVYVKMVHNMTAAWGDDSVCVADQAKRWRFGGNGLQPGGETDSIKFVINKTDCVSGSDAPLSSSDLDSTAMYLASGYDATFTLEPAAAGRSLYVCYKFGDEEYMWYDFRVKVHMLHSVESRVGGSDIAVIDVLEVLAVNANGTSSHDHIRWIAGEGDMSDDACNDTIVEWRSSDEDAEEREDIPIYVYNEAYLVNFTFASSSAGLAPILCYKFAGESSRVPRTTSDRRQRFFFRDAGI